jgi:hypothetical protein
MNGTVVGHHASTIMIKKSNTGPIARAQRWLSRLCEQGSVVGKNSSHDTGSTHGELDAAGPRPGKVGAAVWEERKHAYDTSEEIDTHIT